MLTKVCFAYHDRIDELNKLATDYYNVLGVSRDASIEELKAAHVKLGESSQTCMNSVQ